MKTHFPGSGRRMGKGIRKLVFEALERKLLLSATSTVNDFSTGQYEILTDSSSTTRGLIGSHVDSNLRSYAGQDDWRISQGVMQPQAVAPPMVRIAYVIPSNRSPQPQGVASLQQSMQLMQDWYSDQMERYGFGKKTFLVETQSDGVTPLVHVVRVSQTDSELREDIWDNVLAAASEAGVPVWNSGEVWLLVPEIHQENADGSIFGGTALGAGFGSGFGGGVAMIGSNGLAMMSQPHSLLNDTAYDGLVIPEIGPYPLVRDVSCAWFEGETISSVSSSYHGAVLHELTHAFGMPHDFRNDGNFDGDLMGNGLRGFRGAVYPDVYSEDDMWLSYGQAVALSTSRFFNPLQTVPETTGPGLTVSTSGQVPTIDGQVRISFSATDTSGLASAILVEDGDQVAEIVLNGTAVSTAITTPFFTTGKELTFNLMVYDIYGNRTVAETKVTISSGSPQAPQPYVDLSRTTVRRGEPVVLDAWQSADPSDLTGTKGPMLVEWDLDGDGTFDTASSRDKTFTTSYSTTGDRLVQARITGASGLQAVSEPIAIHVDAGLTEISAVSKKEGASGLTKFTFTVTRPAGDSSPVTMNYATQAGTAIAGVDFVDTRGTLTFKAGETRKTVTVSVLGDKEFETNETFIITMSDAVTGITVAQASATIVNDDKVPTLAISSVKLPAEGNSSTTAFTFNVTLSAASGLPVAVHYATIDRSAKAGEDYAFTSGELTIPAGQLQDSITVQAFGDTTYEANETFAMLLSGPQGAVLAKGKEKATATIINDDAAPMISIGNATLHQSDTGLTAQFLVTLSSASGLDAIVNFSTVAGTAKSGKDFMNRKGTLTIAPGQTSATISIPILGNPVASAGKVFYVKLSRSKQATLLSGQDQGTCTIGNSSLTARMNTRGISRNLASANGSTSIAAVDEVILALTRSGAR